MPRNSKRSRNTDSDIDTDVKRRLTGEQLETLNGLQKALVNSVAKKLATENLYNELGPQGEGIDDETLKKWEGRFDSDYERNKHVQQTLIDLPLDWIASDREHSRKNQVYTYNIKLRADDDPDHEIAITNQGYSGRCWMFAALNYIKRKMIHQYNLERTFELSESHLFFYDKLERANVALHKILSFLNDACVEGTVLMRDEIFCDEEFMHNFTSEGLLSDGGTWPGFVQLITKYGIVPKHHCNETYNSSSSDDLNRVLVEYISSCTRKMQLDFSEKGQKVFRSLKNKIYKEWMPEIMSLLIKFLGKPVESFSWEYYDSADKYHKEEVTTPREFYDKYIAELCTLENKLLLIHDPRNERGGGVPLYHTGCVRGNGTQCGTGPGRSVAVPIELMERCVIDSLKGDDAVWFAADVMSNYDPATGTLCMDSFNYNRALNMELSASKADKLETRVSGPTHAMLFVGANETEAGADRFRVENSWGYTGADNGYHLMTRDWFYQNVFMVVIDRKYIDEESLKLIEENELEPKILNYNDPFGAVARSDVPRLTSFNAC